MLTQIKQLLAPPIFDDEEKTRIASLLNNILHVILGITLLNTIALIVSDPMGFLGNLNSLAITGSTIALVLALHFLARRGNVQLVSALLSLALLAIVTFTVYAYEGLRSANGSGYLLCIILAGLLLGGRGAVISTVLSILAVAGIWYAEKSGFVVYHLPEEPGRMYELTAYSTIFIISGLLLRYAANSVTQALERARRNERALAERAAEIAEAVEETQRLNEQLQQEIAEREQAEAERERLQKEIIEAQQQALKELSTPIIPVMEAPDGSGSIIVMPLIGSIDSMRARDVTRALLAGISQYRAKVVILDITGVPIVDSGVANHLNKTIQAARLKGAYTIVTGISDAVAEAIVDLGIDWSEVATLRNLQTGLVTALKNLGVELTRR